MDYNEKYKIMIVKFGIKKHFRQLLLDTFSLQHNTSMAEVTAGKLATIVTVQ
jgi:hypothetical protein